MTSALPRGGGVDQTTIDRAGGRREKDKKGRSPRRNNVSSQRAQFKASSRRTVLKTNVYPPGARDLSRFYDVMCVYRAREAAIFYGCPLKTARLLNFQTVRCVRGGASAIILRRAAGGYGPFPPVDIFISAIAAVYDTRAAESERPSTRVIRIIIAPSPLPDMTGVDSRIRLKPGLSTFYSKTVRVVYTNRPVNTTTYPRHRNSESYECLVLK